MTVPATIFFGHTQLDPAVLSGLVDFGPFKIEKSVKMVHFDHSRALVLIKRSKLTTFFKTDQKVQ